MTNLIFSGLDPGEWMQKSSQDLLLLEIIFSTGMNEKDLFPDGESGCLMLMCIFERLSDKLSSFQFKMYD